MRRPKQAWQIRDQMLRQMMYASEYRFVIYDLPEDAEPVHHVIPIGVDYVLPDWDLLIADYVYRGGTEARAEQIVRLFEARVEHTDLTRVCRMCLWAVGANGEIDDEMIDVILRHEGVGLTDDRRQYLTRTLRREVRRPDR